MVKICPKCGTSNSDDTFWCIDCDTKLVDGISLQREKESESYNELERRKDIPPAKRIELPTEKESNLLIYGSMFKIPLLIIFIVIIIGVFWYMFYNVDIAYAGYADTLYWENIQNNDLPWSDWSNLDTPWNNNNVQGSTKTYWDNSKGWNNVGEINVDYWFEGDTIRTSDGWTFTITKPMDFSIDGRILDMRVWDKDDDEINIFSPCDLFIGIDDVKDNPDNYPFVTTGYSNRCIYTVFTGGGTEYVYFRPHVDNNHIIPHSKKVLNTLKTLDVGDLVIIEGSIANVHGQKGRTKINWVGDTSFETFGCQVILVDSVVVN